VVKLPVVHDLESHLAALKRCKKCPDMVGPVVAPPPVLSKVYIVGQAPGPREGALGRPFAWTAGKQLFKWLERLGLAEADVRARVYFAAVCRCFPGKTKQKADRVPDADEIENCSGWMRRELEILRPELIIPVGKLAIAQVMPQVKSLNDVIGRQFRLALHGHTADVIPVPHPSGASTWFKVEPGATLTRRALRRIKKHPAWQALLP
jgi:uracil-DNA glycosylase